MFEASSLFGKSAGNNFANFLAANSYRRDENFPILLINCFSLITSGRQFTSTSSFHPHARLKLLKDKITVSSRRKCANKIKLDENNFQLALDDKTTIHHQVELFQINLTRLIEF